MNIEMKNYKNQSGFTLIEVLITMFVMTVGLLGLAGLQSTSLKQSIDTSKRSQTIWLVTELVERIRVNPDLDAATPVDYSGNWTSASCATIPPARCADNSAGDSQACTGTELAAYDTWEVFCGQPGGNDVLANSSESLNLQGLEITKDGDDYTVALSWFSKPVVDSKLMDDTQIYAKKTQTISMTVRP